MKTVMFLLAAACIAAPAIAADGAALYKDKTCNACHGPAGNKPLMPDYPKIAGQNAKYIEKQMTDIKAIAEYLAAQKP